jgi:protease-4
MDSSGQLPIEQPTPSRQKSRSGWKIFWGIVTALSILANIFLFFMLIAVSMFAFAGLGGKNFYIEDVIEKGPSTDKIVVIHLDGIINESLSQEIANQIKQVTEDAAVKGLIISINSPGGTVSASDQIYYEILKYKQLTSRPVIAFMHGLAASGGYYASAACEKIIAEPTVITGSIGVIVNYFVLEQLLEDKLGIQPVVIKSGLRKDWPSLFHKPSDEQLKYLQEKIISPAYNRFVNIVANSRKALTVEQVKELADGSIYSADEALDKKLIDSVGYFDEALDTIKSLAGISQAKVVEYRKPFSWGSLISMKADSVLRIDTSTMNKLSTPDILYLWSIH